MKKIKGINRMFWVVLPVLMVVCSRDNGTGPDNRAPTASIEAPYRAFLNRVVNLHAVAYDGDGTISRYMWRIGTNPWIVSSSADTSFISPSNNQQLICSLQVTDNGGLSVVTAKKIIIEGVAPIPKILQPFMNAGLNDTVRLRANASDILDSGKVVDFEWKIGFNGWRSVKKVLIDTLTFDTLIVSDTVIQMPATPQSLLCSLRVTDNDGLKAYDRITINVYSKPATVVADANLKSVFTNMSVKLLGKAITTGNDSVVEWAWKIGSRPWNVTARDTVIKPEVAGSLVCSLRVTNVFGVISSSAVIITVKQSDLLAIAQANPQVVFINNPVQLIGKSTSSNGDPIVEWAWKIGNKQWNITRKDTIIKPEEGGTLSCSLRVVDVYGNIAKTGIFVTVQLSNLIALADADPKVIYINSPVRLIGRTSSSSNEAITEWAWKIGTKPWVISKSDTIIRPEQAGALQCSLRVVGSFGTIAKAEVIVIVNQPNVQAIADAEQKVVDIVTPIRLLGNASIMSNDQIVEWAWKIGSKLWSITGKDTTIMPEAIGTLVCSLRVTDLYGVIAKTAVNITIKPASLQAIAGVNIKTGLNDPVQLHGYGLPEKLKFTYRWKIGPNPWRISGQDTTIISAPSEQTWLCSLEVADEYGQTAKDALILYSKSQPPIAKAMAAPMIVPINGTIRLTGEGVDEEGVIRYEWKIGDYPWRQTAKDTAVIAPNTAQILRCSLKVIDRDYEESKASVDIRITSNPVIAYAGEDTIVSIDSDFRLHGQELSGAAVTEWWWKIDRFGMWRRTSTSDTIIHTASLPTTVVCSLRVITNNTNEGFDEIILHVKNIANNRIVYSKTSSESGIYSNSLNFDTEALLQSDGKDPKWSPNGQKIAFVRTISSQQYLYVMDWNGGNVRQLSSTVGAQNPSWYNDSRTLSYDRYYNGRYAVYKIDIDGNNNTEVFTVANRRVEEPYVNPTNQNEIVFLNSSTSTNTTGIDNKQIYIHSLSSGENLKIKGNSSRNTTRSNVCIYNDRILWDGSTQTTNFLQTVARGDTANVVSIESTSSYDFRGVFSKEGSSIYYARISNSSTTFFRCDLFGGNKEQLNTVTGRVEDFDIK